MRTTRKELSAALLTWHAPDDEELVALLRSYRQRSGRELLQVAHDAPNVINFEGHGPGPRRGSGRHAT
jgi:hypothetical protein